MDEHNYPDGEPTRSLDDVLAGNLRRIRAGLEWTQGDIAEGMSACGHKWTATTCAWVETGRRRLTGAELLELCRILGVKPGDMIAGDGWYGAKWQARTLGKLRAALTHPAKPTRSDPSATTSREETRKLANRLGITRTELEAVAGHLYGRPVLAERDARIGDTKGVSPRTVQAKRGRAMRDIRVEIETTITVHHGDDGSTAITYWAPEWAKDHGAGDDDNQTGGQQ